VFSEGELDEKSNVHFLHIPFSDKPVKAYSLNVIISVGYRVKSIRGTQFRIWATNVLHEYLLRGYVVNTRLAQLEDKVDRRLAKTEADVVELKRKVDFFVQTKEPPLQSIFFGTRAGHWSGENTVKVRGRRAQMARKEDYESRREISARHR
jgi:hypothetical protein